MVDEVLELTRTRPHHDLAIMRRRQTLDSVTAGVLGGLGPVVASERPDVVVVQGDTTTAVAAALTAYHARIPVCHVEAGLRTGKPFDPWPEMANRRMIACVASLHCAPTSRAAEALMREGVDAASVHVTGNTGVDALRWIVEGIAGRRLPIRQAQEILELCGPRRLILVTAHRRESRHDRYRGVVAAVRSLSRQPDGFIVVVHHAHPDSADPFQEGLAGQDNVPRPLAPPDLIRLLQSCHLVMSDGGRIQEEAPVLGKPVLILRNCTERVEAIEAGSALLATTSPDEIVKLAIELLTDESLYRHMAQPRMPFGVGGSAQRIANLLAARPVRDDAVLASENFR